MAADMRVVITGAGHGIGAALARRLAAEGARVVVNDLDAEAARSVAAQVDGTAVPGDAASEDGVAALLTRAREVLGEVTVYVANAGLDVRRGLDAPEADWARSFEVNVMAHVRAARLLVPRWLETGGGRFVATASAGGLLTVLGNAPYSVTKHATVGFAEWLSASYGHRGVVVQVICPQGVRTQMLEDAGALRDQATQDAVLEPEDVAEVVWQSFQDDRFLILPHPEVARYYAYRATDTDRWLAAMRRLQQQAEEGAP